MQNITDTAARDIHDLEDKGVLRMAQGRVRDASYSLVYSHEKLQYENLTATEHDGNITYQPLFRPQNN
jgi:hypothetical protein